jgi:molecular chaperone DnaK (HSP70)
VKLLLGGERDLHSRVYGEQAISSENSSGKGSSLRLRKSDGSVIWVEEALAHLFAYAKDVAEAEGKEPVEDVVVTVKRALL